MKQILHIFRKDVRHHWVVILLCQAALVAFCWNEVESWKNIQAMAFAGMTSTFLGVSWCLFVFRAVQSESLVGDRQFWLTRPYEWKKLLAEKILMVLVFLDLPLVVAGAILLALAGFSPAPHLLGLLWMQLLLLAGPLLILLALASVTKNLIPAAVTLLSLFLLMFGFAAFSLFFNGGGMVGFSLSTPSLRGEKDYGDVIVVLVCLVAVVLQFARRRTTQSRLWLAGGALALVALSLGTPYATRNRDPFPTPAGQSNHFHASLDRGRLVASKRAVEKNETVPIGIPLSSSGIPEDSLGWVRGMRLILETPDGYRWDGRWPGSTQLLRPGDNRWRAMFQMEYEAYERLRPVPLKAHVSMLANIFREHGYESITTTAGEFDVPRVGRCRLWRRDGSTLRCNSPLVRPSMVVARVDPAVSTCPIEDNPSAIPPKPLNGLPYAWQHGGGGTLPAGGISPVAASLFYFWEFSDRVNICPGTPVMFSLPEFTESVRVDFEIDNVQLDDYRQADFSSSPITGPDWIRLGLPAPR